ncbi:AcrR family transcriptional regulator [Nocardiopsis mwathae]|uniref:AcrR family transcriptional regulator n=1 Tax=Nocardiopsis mwathae TaxID=1472723 RepID=A0A7W9YGG7_9ACTN|nr:TetR family transcriptional regulator [Nocardiopsis mwathae]MBB6171714.1 AcrR family transcriptional regulator [Nocardiopsis mwathae]
MNEPTGLRERKKQRTRRAISEAAVRLFQESGFDQVSVADVAAAAEVSKPTLFAYFPSKEDLVLHRFADHETEAARVVRARHDGEAPLTALRRHFVDGLDRHDPITGLNDTREVLDFQHLLYSTPALLARLPAYMLRGEDALAEALAETGGTDPFTARLAAGQVIATQRVLSTRNVEEMRAGRSADDVHPEAVARAHAAFDLLENGLGSAFGLP